MEAERDVCVKINGIERINALPHKLIGRRATYSTLALG